MTVVAQLVIGADGVHEAERVLYTVGPGLVSVTGLIVAH